MNSKKTKHSRSPIAKVRKSRNDRLPRSLFVPLWLTVALVTLVVGNTIVSSRGSLPATASSAEQTDERISAAVAAQIESLVQEKRTRTPAQQKVDSQLIYAMKMSRGEPIAAGVQSLTVDVARIEGDPNMVVVDIIGKITPSLLDDIKANGGNVVLSMPDYRSVRAEIPLDRLENIAESPDVFYLNSKQEADLQRRAPVGPNQSGNSFEARAARVRDRLTAAFATADQDAPASSGTTTNVGARQSEADVVHRANIARARYGVNGTGVKIGVLSDGVLNLSFAQASGDLPPDVTVLPGQAGTGDEGTAMLELVHDIAPGAKLFFATGFISLTNFADNIRKLRTAGCDIIVDDIGYFVETPMQDGQVSSIVSNTNGGAITQAVNDVTAAGAIYFSSAGNSGNLNDGTGGVWEGDFVNGGTLALIGGAGAGPVHDFDSTAAVSQFNRITVGSGNPITLHWSDPLGASANDYDLYILNAAGTALVAASTGSQSGTQDPFEQVGGGANVTNNRIVVAKFSGADRFLNVSTHRGRLLFATDGQIRGHSISALAYSVAATPATPPFPNPYDSTAQVETFSSDGPRRIFFQPDGTPYTPGVFSSAGGTLRQKPDITASDGNKVSGAGGFSNPFFGTSAAAPNAGAIAALVKSAVPGITPAQLRAALNGSAIDIEAAGIDRDSGVGIIMADTALQVAGAAQVPLELGTVTATESAGNGNTFVEPGERGSLTVQLRNNTAGTVTNVVGTLTSSTPGVTIVPPGTSNYPDIAGNGGTQTNTTPFQFIVASNVPCPTQINFTLTVTLTGATSPQVFNFSIGTGRATTVNTTLDPAAPSNGEGFTASTGLQTGRLVRTSTGSMSSCGIQKANPQINAADANVPHRFDAYTFQNPSTSPICVTVTLETSVANAGLLQSVAYAPTFEPTRVSDNYLGDIAGNGPATRTYSFIVAANTTFVVVVNEVTGGSGAIPYTLTVGGLPCVTAPPKLVTLQFALANTQIQENCTAVTLQVLRNGDTSLPVTFDYTTVSGTASPRSDYTDGVGRVTIPAGSTSANIFVLISEDSLVEGTEAFTVALSNLQGVEVGLGAIPVATVEILDDAVEPATNAIDDVPTFVCQQYHDFLAREPDNTGFTNWVNTLNGCPNGGFGLNNPQCDRVRVALAFFQSQEFQTRGYFIYRFYIALLGRRPTYTEFITDLSRIGGALSPAQEAAAKAAFATEFTERAEFRAKYDAFTAPDAFVNELLTTAGVTIPNKDFLIIELAAGRNTRAQTARAIVESVQVEQKFFNEAFVSMQYFGHLRRNPDTTGFNNWLTTINSTSNYRAISFGFIYSTEYRSRFGTP